ncbi:MAG: hypothetical protein GT589_08085 [Peptoclostridium sp.]|uniref:hypothetical protein n=1 Tax=Peptoclostridium sp. TaxID=1904860 RepID=UPI00139D4702|nr:hypothetical protein [Peptoclostridium sp.]MZQ76090.1 hypothetical protein [Peptoclostridium sp.]
MINLLENKPIFIKEVDWSTLNYGISIPVIHHDEILDFFSVKLQKGRTHRIKITIEDSIYDALLINQNAQGKRNILQIRYSPGSNMVRKLRELFHYSFGLLKEQKDNGFDLKSDEDVYCLNKEYINIYKTRREGTLLFECTKYCKQSNKNTYCNEIQSECADKKEFNLNELHIGQTELGNEMQHCYISNKEAFISWMKDQGYCESIIESNIKNINEIVLYARKTNKFNTNIFDLHTHGEFNKAYGIIFSDRAFKNKYKDKYRDYSIAMNKYLRYLKNGKQNKIVEGYSFEEEVDYSTTDENTYNGMCSEESKEEQEKDRRFDFEIASNENADFNDSKNEPNQENNMIITILDNYFKNGIKLESYINIKKFMMELTKVYPDYKLPDDIEVLKDKIRSVAIQCLDDLYMTQNTIVNDKELINEITRTITDTFEAGRKLICIDNVFEIFKERLLDSNIYNGEILENVIKYYLKDGYIYRNGTIMSETGADLNLDNEVLEVLYGCNEPTEKNKIFEMLNHISKETIEQILDSDNRSIYVQKNIYWHIDRFEVTEEDKLLLDDIIRYEIKDGFISIKKLLCILNDKADDFIQKNNIINHVCLHDILKYYFEGVFGFKYTFIGKKEEDMSGPLAVQNFLKEKDAFLLSELSEFVEENDLPKQYAILVDESKKTFLRINEQEFIKKDNFNIKTEDLKNIEEVINKYITNGFCVVSKIDSFSILPSLEYRWNSFLLESIIENYFSCYKLIKFSRSVTKPISVIVDITAGFNSPEDVLTEALAEYDKCCPLKNQEEALQYLFDNGYIAQKRYKGIEVLYLAAKQKNSKR